MTIRELKEGIEKAIADGIPADAIIEGIGAIRYTDENLLTEITTINLKFRHESSHYQTTIGWNSSLQNRWL